MNRNIPFESYPQTRMQGDLGEEIERTSPSIGSTTAYPIAGGVQSLAGVDGNGGIILNNGRVPPPLKSALGQTSSPLKECSHQVDDRGTESPGRLPWTADNFISKGETEAAQEDQMHAALHSFASISIDKTSEESLALASKGGTGGSCLTTRESLGEESSRQIKQVKQAWCR